MSPSCCGDHHCCPVAADGWSVSFVGAVPGGTASFGGRWEELEDGARAQPAAGVQTGREEEALSKALSRGVEGRGASVEGGQGSCCAPLCTNMWGRGGQVRSH